ncbi:MAG: hypothetical protein K0S74_1094 [Chlamydiales bacterium]|jgi:hypothetical protein|nr:hypothetical protein [Chlamydiales bacterium]
MTTLYSGTAYTGISDFNTANVLDANDASNTAFVGTNLSANTIGNRVIVTEGKYVAGTTPVKVHKLFAACTEIAFNRSDLADTASAKIADFKTYMDAIGTNETAITLTNLDNSDLSASNTAIKTAILGASKLANINDKTLQKNALKYFLSLTRPDGTNTTTENALESLLNCYMYQHPKEAAQVIFEAVAESSTLTDPVNIATLDATKAFDFALIKLKQAFIRTIALEKKEPDWINTLLDTAPSLSYTNLAQAKAIVSLAVLEPMYTGAIHEYVLNAKTALGKETTDPTALPAADIEAKIVSNTALNNYYELATGKHAIRFGKIKTALINYVTGTGVNLQLAAYIGGYTIDPTIVINSTNPEKWSRRILLNRRYRDWLDLMNSLTPANLETHFQAIATAAAPWTQITTQVAFTTKNWKAYSNVLDLYTADPLPSATANATYLTNLTTADPAANLSTLVNNMIAGFPKESMAVLAGLNPIGRISGLVTISSLISTACSNYTSTASTALAQYTKLAQEYGIDVSGTLTGVKPQVMVSTLQAMLSSIKSGVIPATKSDAIIAAAKNLGYTEVVQVSLPVAYTLGNTENALVKIWMNYISDSTRTANQFANALNSVTGAYWPEWLEHSFNYKSSKFLFNCTRGSHPFLANCIAISCDADPVTNFGATHAARAKQMLEYALSRYPREIVDYVCDFIASQTASSVASLSTVTANTLNLLSRAIIQWLKMEIAAVGPAQVSTKFTELKGLLASSKYLERTNTSNTNVNAALWLSEVKNELALAMKRASKDYGTIGVSASVAATLATVGVNHITDTAMSTTIDGEVVVNKMAERWIASYATV